MKRIFFAITCISLSIVLSGAVHPGSSAQSTNQEPVKGVTQGGVRLYKEMEDLTSVIRVIPANTEVVILSNHGEYFLVKDGDNTGYVKKDKIATGQANPPVVQQQAVQQQEVKQEVVQQQPDSRMTYLEAKYGKNIAVRIYAGKIWKGMTVDMVKDAWGEPDRINQVVVKSVKMEEYIYRSTWLLMEKGTLKEWGPITK